MRATVKFTLALVLGCLVLLPAAQAAVGAPTPPAQQPPMDLPWGRVVWGTLVVIGIICLGVFLLKKVGGGVLVGRGRYMELLEVRPVMRGVNLFLVRVAGRIVLLGSTGQQVTQLTEFPEDELPVLEEPEKAVGLEGFRALLSKLGGAQQ